MRDHGSYWTLLILPSISREYAVDDPVRHWGYFPKLVYTGPALNESWTGSIYFSADIMGRTVA